MKIPEFVKQAISALETANFEAFIVGGSLRDLLLDLEPKDWDLTTNARPEEVLQVFPTAHYENVFGTVILPIKDEANNVLEITTYRSEGAYSDRRHPDQINFEDSLDKDLERRDFTINALALGRFKVVPESLKKFIEPIEIDKQEYYLVDLFGGREDLKKKIIRAVGEPSDRFKEDALRMMRAVRFTSQLDFVLEPKTERAIAKLAGIIKFIAPERIKDELIKILSSNKPANGIFKMHELNLLRYIIPELEDGVGVRQYYHHIYPVFEHNLRSLDKCPSLEWPVRLAALLHDVGKPKVFKMIDGQGTFYNHEYVGAKITERIMKRLKFSTADSLRVVNLVRNHMFYYSVGEVTAASVRRLIAKTGRDNLRDLIDIRIADRLGSGDLKPKPYKLRHLEYMFEKVQNDPVSVKMLKINGDDLIRELKLEPSPKMGAMLEVLLSEVLEDPKFNEYEYLLKQARTLNSLDLEALRAQAKAIIAKRQAEDDQALKRDFKV